MEVLMRTFLFLPLAIFFLTLSTSALQANTIHVPADSATIQAGINGAVDGDTVLVAYGVYTGDGNRDIDFGGKSIVVMSALGPEVTIIDCEGSPLEPHRGFWFHSGEDSNSVLQGFMIINGQSWTNSGGGIRCEGSSPTIAGNIITENDAGPSGSNGSGGGISCLYSSSPIIKDNVISNNNSENYGGGISCSYSSSPIIMDNVIQDNFAEAGGGGILVYSYCSPTVVNNVINENQTGEGGGGGAICLIDFSWGSIQGNTVTKNEGGILSGGIYCMNYSSPVIEDNIISENIAFVAGGIGLWFRSSPTIRNNWIRNNIATEGSGGGIYCSESSPTVQNNMFSGNSAQEEGGGIWIYKSGVSGSLTVTNCTFSENSAYIMGGGIYTDSCGTEITNCILWGDHPDEIRGDTLTVSFSNVQGGWGGEGNIDIDPLFRDPVVGDFHLMAVACADSSDSPCIDAGCPDSSDLILDCDHGLGMERCDMGAFGGRGGPPVSINKSRNPESTPLPKTTRLFQNYPNPFNPSTTIAFDVPGISGIKQRVEVTVYDIRGKQVTRLIDSDLEPGNHRVVWNGRNDKGQPVSSGIYLYTLRSGGKTSTRKMVALK